MVRTVPVLVVGVFVMGGGEATRLLGRLGSLGLIVLVLLVVGGYAWASWTRLQFYFDDDGDLRIDSGLIFRNERRVQLSRLQSVDITQPLLARVFGLAELKPDVAGASGEGTTLRYLSLADAGRLRADLLARAAGMRDGEPEPAVTERILVQVPTPHLLASLALQPAPILLLIAIPVTVAVAGVSGVWELGIAGIFLVFTPFTIVIGQFLNYFGFTVAESADGLRLRFGLTSHRSQTVPPGRVQALRIERPLLWRPWGWARVVVNVAGTTGGEDGGERPATVLPVAPLPVARAVMQRILHDVDALAIDLHPAPDAARRRAPLQHRNLGVAATDSLFVTSRGWLVPKVDVVPHARTQSVRVTQGPWQRLLGLASVHVDSTPGPIRIAALHRPAAEAREIADAQADRARRARIESRRVG
jgi:putative membrane protein